jgi:4-alpha-glucanotransferase
VTRSRSCGILLHVTSLPGKYGTGGFGPEADRFLEWLAEGDQTIWQILPLNPPAGGGSPYTSPSAFAGNPLMISPELLLEEGLIEPHDLPGQVASGAIHFDTVARSMRRVLRTAWARAKVRRDTVAEIDRWAGSGSRPKWLDDWALFATLKRTLGDTFWADWPAELKYRNQKALDRVREREKDEYRFHRFVQWVFFRQWQRVRQKAHSLGISIFGDAPIYVSTDSADVWSHPDRFLLDERLLPVVVAGVPPDYFSATGQLWGNPIYDWAAMRSNGFAWWSDRIALNLERFDVLRLDHFRAFASYWEVPATEPTAIRGRWIDGPGLELFDRIEQQLGALPLVAEDLGTITPDVEELLAQTAFPGMKVMQFGFGEKDNIHLPHLYDGNTIGYTGTHDNDTFLGWFRGATPKQQRHALRYLGASAETDLPERAIRALHASPAAAAILPMQDVLGLDSSARMNTPGTTEGNWRWRLAPEQLRGDDAERLAALVREYDRGDSFEVNRRTE